MDSSTAGYVPRLVDQRLVTFLAQLPALLVTGPRAAGKTTTARRLAKSVVRMDSRVEAEPFRADPDAVLRRLPEPVLLDEWQAVPDVLGAVKRAVDDDPRPGRFLLTGSVRAILASETWPGTGRLVHLPMYGLTQRELLGRVAGPTFLDKLARCDIELFDVVYGTAPDLVEYVEMALRGGFPEASLRLSGEPRSAWLDGYVNQLLTRDAEPADGPRKPARLRRYFEAVALNTAGLVDNRTLYEAAGIDRKTATAYDDLLANLFVLDRLPAWSSNRLSRLMKGPKRYVTDPSLVGSVLRLDEGAVLRDGDLMGRLIDTFVLAQLRPELDLSPARPRLYHMREKDQRREIDIVAEMAANQIVALEIKASAAPTPADAKHLRWLRDALGDRFLAGAVLHTGPRPFPLADRVFALPICALWS